MTQYCAVASIIVHYVFGKDGNKNRDAPNRKNADDQPQMNTDEHRLDMRPRALNLSVFIGVNLWPDQKLGCAQRQRAGRNFIAIGSKRVILNSHRRGWNDLVAPEFTRPLNARFMGKIAKPLRVHAPFIDAAGGCFCAGVILALAWLA